MTQCPVSVQRNMRFLIKHYFITLENETAAHGDVQKFSISSGKNQRKTFATKDQMKLNELESNHIQLDIPWT